MLCVTGSFFFFFNDTATTEIYTLSLHDALPIWHRVPGPAPCLWLASALPPRPRARHCAGAGPGPRPRPGNRSEEHTSELQSQSNLVCRLLLEKKKTTPLEVRRPPRDVRWNSPRI